MSTFEFLFPEIHGARTPESTNRPGEESSGSPDSDLDPLNLDPARNRENGGGGQRIVLNEFSVQGSLFLSTPIVAQKNQPEGESKKIKRETIDLHKRLMPSSTCEGDEPAPLFLLPSSVAGWIHDRGVLDAGLRVQTRVPQTTESLRFDQPGVFDGDAQVDLALQALDACDEVGLTTRATALTPWSAPLTAHATQGMGGGMTLRDYLRVHACSVQARPRLRLLSVWPLRWRAERDLASSNPTHVATRDLDPDDRLFVFDWDAMSETAQRGLLRGLSGKVWVGIDLSVDLQWIRWVEPSVSPSFLLDVRLMANCFRPGLLYEAQNQLSEGAGYDDVSLPRWTPERGQRLARLLLSLERKTPSSSQDAEESSGFSLNVLSQILLDHTLEPVLQKPTHWMPSVLSAAHQASCQDGTRRPVRMARRLLRLRDTTRTDVLLDQIRQNKGGHAYDIVQRATPRLVRMQANGIPVSEPAVRDYVRSRRAKASEAIDFLLQQAPELAPFREDLARPGQGSAAFRHALALALERLSGVAPPRQKQADVPRLDLRTLRHLYPDLPLRHALEQAKSSLRNGDLALDFLARARNDPQSHRVHPLTTVSAVTLRTTSKEPNGQSTPSRDPDFKTIYRARPGFKMVSVDYSAIEMRIAAVLAMRVYRQVRKLLDLARALQESRQKQSGVSMATVQYNTVLSHQMRLAWIFGVPGDLDRSGFPYLIDWMLDGHPPQGLDVHRLAQNPPQWGDPLEVWRLHHSANLFLVFERLRAAGAFAPRREQDTLTLVEVFRQGLDPHLLTAIKNEVRLGRFDAQGRTPFEHLTACRSEERRALKKQLSQPRQQAKAENFGLLYGMSAVGFDEEDGGLYLLGRVQYGLNWTREEAIESKAGWLHLYPEIDLWQRITRLRSTRNARVSFSEPSRPRTRGPDESGPAGKIWTSSTLSGREVVADRPGTLMNYCDQGSGAEIALAACNAFPEHILDRWINFVHDEYVFEVEAEQAESFAQEVSRIMETTARAFLFEVFGHPQATPWGCPVESEVLIGDHWSH